jgi:NYN domain
MTRIALLVDWENVQRRLGDLYYPTDAGVLVPRLMAAVERMATQEVGGYVCYHRAFAPLGAFPAQSLQHFADHLQIESTRGGKNAADLAIVVAALRLHYRNEADVFILVTGDIDYLVLASALAADGRVCHVWAIDNGTTNIDLRNWRPFAWVPELLDLDQLKPPSPRDNKIFLFACQRLLDDGVFLGVPDRTVPKLQELHLLGEETVRQLYNLWLSNGMRKKDAVLLDRNGKPEKRGGQLTYEMRDDIRLPLWLGTLCLDTVARKLSRERASSTRGDLLKILDYPGIRSGDRDELYETLIKCGYLVVTGDRVTGRSSVRRDLLGGQLRIAVQVLYAQGERDWELAGGGYLARRWERVVVPGRTLNAVEQAEAKAEASAALRSAAAAGVVCSGVDEQNRYGYRLNTDHPLVVFAQESVKTIVIRLNQRKAWQATPVRYLDFAQELSASPVNWTKAEMDFWLGTCAAEQIVTWKQGQVWLNKSKFADRICN